MLFQIYSTNVYMQNVLGIVYRYVIIRVDYIRGVSSYIFSEESFLKQGHLDCNSTNTSALKKKTAALLSYRSFLLTILILIKSLHIIVYLYYYIFCIVLLYILYHLHTSGDSPCFTLCVKSI